ncbi:hypothetical protein ACFL0P_06460 [Candidatus Omnitrophota bacterium]
MKRLYLSLLLTPYAIFMISALCFAATVGNPLDLDVPSTSALLRQEIVENTLDEHDQIVKIKASLDMEFVFDKDLDTTWEVSNAEMKGQWYMLKLATTIFNRVEPYIKLGTSNLQVKWTHFGSQPIEVEADYGFAWGGGVKGIIWDFDDYGIRLTGDFQYRTTEPDVEEISLDSSSVTDTGADFEVEEWQLAFVLSKKYQLPLKMQDIYIVPYTGLTFSDSTVDVKFNNPNLPATDYSIFDAGNDSTCGFLLGCDIMPTMNSSFIYSIEARLANEYALTLGGAMKF